MGEVESVRVYYEANKRRWNELVGIHAKSGGYDVTGFLRGKSSLHAPELEALPGVEGKTLLHLQCYFGLDTLSWARRGAKVTGVDFSDKAIDMARLLAEKTGLEAEFINCNLYDLPQHLDSRFDIVYTSYGVLCWLNDIEEWARIVARYLKPGGTFFLAEFHPLVWIYDDDHPSDLVIRYDYWHKAEPDHYVSDEAYASGGVKLRNTDEYGWAHPMGTVVTALIEAGLTIQSLREYPYSVDEDQFKFMKKDAEGNWRLPGDPLPLMYSIKARAFEQIEDKNQQLERLNKELEALSYSASHDLRAPLRSIDGFSKILLEDYDESLDDAGRDYLHRVRAATQRMGQLIDDLLALSRITQMDMKIQEVDLSKTAQSVAEELTRDEPDRKVEWHIQPELLVRGDEELLKIAVGNLIDNSWKFTSKKEKATIEIGSTVVNGETAFFVRDDGAGFDMRYVHKLFTPFQRLHLSEDFPGTGIGLAIVQRVINRHGGRVWAEGDEGKGATFYFTIKL